MSIKIVLGIVTVTGILLMVMIFSNSSPEISEQKQVPVVVMETELEPETIDIAVSIDTAIIEPLLEEADTPSYITENTSQSSLGVLSYDDREYNAMTTRERREAKRQHQKAYKRLRKEWRKDLKAALLEARESSDYTYYEELKSNPPDKNDLTLGW